MTGWSPPQYDMEGNRVCGYCRAVIEFTTRSNAVYCCDLHRAQARHAKIRAVVSNRRQAVVDPGKSPESTENVASTDP